MIGEKKESDNEIDPSKDSSPKLEIDLNDLIPHFNQESLVFGLPEFCVGDDRDAKILSLLTDQKVHFRTVDATEKTLLNVAAGSEENELILEAAESRIKQIADEEERIRFVNHPDRTGFPPLYTAIIHFNDGFAAMLIRHGAVFTFKVPSSLLLAEEKEPAPTTSSDAEVCLEKTIVQESTQEFGSLLFEAYHHKMHQTLIELGKREAELTIEELRFLLPKSQTALDQKDLESMRNMYWIGLLQDVARYEETVSLLVWAFESKMDEIFVGLVDDGATLNENDKKRFYNEGPMIFEAIERGKTALVQAVITAGADVNAKRGCVKYPPLHLVTEKGNLELVDILLAAGAEVNAIDGGSSKRTALHIATEKGYLPIVKSLIASGANPNLNQGGIQKKTALMIATEGRDLSIVNCLINSGAIVDAKYEGQSALHMAAKNGDVPIARSLINAGADVNLNNGTTQTNAFRYAIEKGSLEMVKMLAYAGADVNLYVSDRYYDGYHQKSNIQRFLENFSKC